MKLNINHPVCSLLLFLIIALSCKKHQHTKAEIEQAMIHYDSLILKQDPIAVAQAFTPDGKLGDVATGRETIQKLLSQATDYKVIEQSSTTFGIQIRGDSAIQQGSYIQEGINAKNDTIKTNGT